MNSRVACLIFAAMLGACSDRQIASPEHATFDEESSTGPIVTFSNEDVEMNLAVQRAQREVAIFRERLLNPTASQQIGLKAKFGAGNEHEHMWVANPRVEGDGFQGVLANEPAYLQTPKLGDTVTVSVDEVSDWYVYDEGRLQGAYTLRVIRKRLDPENQKLFDESNGFVAE